MYSIAEVLSALVHGFCLSPLFLHLVRVSIPIAAKRRTILISLAVWSSLASPGPVPTHDMLENFSVWLSGPTEAFWEGFVAHDTRWEVV